MLINPKLSLNYANNLTSTVQHLRSNLQAIQPNQNEITQTITYTLIATALVGIAVYHYIKAQENHNN